MSSANVPTSCAGLYVPSSPPAFPTEGLLVPQLGVLTPPWSLSLQVLQMSSFKTTLFSNHLLPRPRLLVVTSPVHLPRFNRDIASVRNSPCLGPSHLQASLSPWGCRRGLPAALALCQASRRLIAEPAPFSGPCCAEHPRECGRCASCPLGPKGQGDRRGYLPRRGRSQYVPRPGGAELGLAGRLLGGSCFLTSNSVGAVGGFTWKTLQSPACGRGGGRGCQHLLTGNQRDPLG